MDALRRVFRRGGQRPAVPPAEAAPRLHSSTAPLRAESAPPPITERAFFAPSPESPLHDEPNAPQAVTPIARPAIEPARPVAAGQFLAGVFENQAGQRGYRLFVSGGPRPEAGRPLLVMLHGCKQDALDFANGTRMNELAQEQGWLVLYPEQDRASNPLRCWNWFRRSNQLRDQGEPSIIADLTREVIATHGADPRRVYVAGISAGGAMASILASNYPDLFAAVGVHSGLPHAAASDLLSALRAMKRGPSPRAAQRPAATVSSLPTIVFHGDHDRTVHPSNGEEVIAQARWTSLIDAEDVALAADVSTEQGMVPDGHRYTRTVHRDAQGRVDAEHWLVHGSAHAWSGGDPKGSYTDPLGPDASREMLRFFAAHPKQEEANSLSQESGRGLG